MKHFFLLISLILVSTVAGSAQNADVGTVAGSYASTAAKAQRYFDNGEWHNAAAMYTLMTDARPDLISNYSHAIVSNAMAGDTIAVSHLLERSMHRDIPLDSLLNGVKQLSIKAGSTDRYEQFLYNVRRSYPWLSRTIDSYLMSYYEYRDNGPMMILYAQRMLRGMPGDIRFSRVLARGYLITGNYADAVKTWQDILLANPREYNTILSLANYYYAAGLPADALPYFRQAQQLRPTPHVQQMIELCIPHKK